MKQVTNDVLVIASIILMVFGFFGAIILFVLELVKSVIQGQEMSFYGVLIGLVMCLVGSVGLVLLGVKPTKEGQ